MKIKDNLFVRQIGKEYLMVSESGSGLNYTRVISLNYTAAFLVEKVGNKSFTREDWVEMLVQKYSISRELANKDVDNLIKKLKKENLLED
jgi:hypothetical protein